MEDYIIVYKHSDRFQEIHNSINNHSEYFKNGILWKNIIIETGFEKLILVGCIPEFDYILKLAGGMKLSNSKYKLDSQGKIANANYYNLMLFTGEYNELRTIKNKKPIPFNKLTTNEKIDRINKNKAFNLEKKIKTELTEKLREKLEIEIEDPDTTIVKRLILKLKNDDVIQEKIHIEESENNEDDLKTKTIDDITDDDTETEVEEDLKSNVSSASSNTNKKIIIMKK